MVYNLVTKVSQRKAGKKVGLLFRTKTQLEYQKMFKQFGPRYKVYTSNTDDEVIKEFQEFVGVLLAHYVCCLSFTSKCTVGADIQTEFDCVFVDFRGQGCTARNVLQMIGRFRNLAVEFS